MDKSNNIVAIKAVNSINFIETVFYYFNKKIPVAIVKSSDNPECEYSINKYIEPSLNSGWLDIHYPLIEDESPAQIVYSSGTEGQAKAILLNHKSLSNTVSRLNSVMKTDSSIREYIGIPVYYSFGFGRARAVLQAGGKAFIPGNGFNPVEIRKLLENNEINAISAVPTLWRLILNKPDILLNQGHKVRWIEIGSQYMSANEKKQMSVLFPNAIIVQHYGLTEASRTTFLVINETPDEFLSSVGRISDNVDIEISESQQIKIRGEHLASGILKNKKLVSITDEDNWLTTSDLGHIKDGYLYYDGRSDDLINCAGVKINPDTVQNLMEHNLDLSNRLSISKYNCEVRGEGFLISVLKDVIITDEALITSLFNILSSYSISVKSSIKVFRVKEFPLTNTGKIKRKRLTEEYHDLKRPQLLTSKPDNRPKYKHVLYNRYSDVFTDQNINDTSSFTSLGGDSLNYVQISMILQDYFDYLPDKWELLTLKDLSNIKHSEIIQKQKYINIDSSIILRVIAIFAVVLTHSGFNFTGGGTLLLFMLVGYNMGRFKHDEFVDSGVWNWYGVYAIKILIPYVILSILIMLKKHEVDLSSVFLVTNLMKLELTVVFPFWFVQVLLQSLFLIALLFSVKTVRTHLKQQPWFYSLLILFVLCLVRFYSPLLWDTSYLRDLVPQRYIIFIWLGYCFSFLVTHYQKMLMLIIGISLTYLDLDGSYKIYWLTLGSVTLAFIPYLTVPSVIKYPIYSIANSTFYIFIFHGLILSVLFRYIESGILLSLISIFVCVVIWNIADYLRLESKVLHLVKRLIGK